jgi:hypothetical protein
LVRRNHVNASLITHKRRAGAHYFYRNEAAGYRFYKEL